ncbi:MAG: hypothetical protein QOC79_9, partial [Actinomycetota bacterium]|nr:hypothetical protein [Actinomycetota bacterium]
RWSCIAHGMLAFAHAESGESEAAGDAVEEMLNNCDGLDDETKAVCLHWGGGALFFGAPDGFVRVISLLEDAAACARRAGRPDTERMVCGLLALAHLIRGEWSAGETYAAQVDTEPGSSIAATNATYGLQYAAWVRGRFDEARALIERIPVVINPRATASLELSRLQIDLAQGTDSGAAERLDTLIADARRRGFSSAVGQLGWGPGTWRMANGDVVGGAEAVVEWFSDSPWPWGTFVIVALLALGRLGEARQQIESEQLAFWGAEASAMRATFETVLNRLEGDVRSAELLGHVALTAHHAGGFRPQLVHTLEALSGIAAAQESYVECARLAGAAQALRDEMGYVLRWPYETILRDADFAVARTAIGTEAFDAAFADGHQLDEDAAVEYAQRARGERKRPTTGWESLTPTEVNVVRLVAAGLTNKEVGRELLMGAETVKTHLSHVYDKLGLHSRAALASEFASRTDSTATPERT